MKEVALITGASEGMGFEFSKLLAAKKFDLILTARNGEKLLEIKTLLENKYFVKIYVLPKDLSNENSAKELYAEVKMLDLKITTLINNAGFGDYGKFTETSLDKELQMIQLNISSLVSLTKYILIEMQKNNYGKILNVASLLAFFPMPLYSIYAATKSFVLSFSEALSNELNQTNISVTCLCPGPTKTKFTSQTEMDDSRAYKYMKQANPEDVAKLGIRAMLKGKRTVIYGLGNNVLAFSTRLGPRWLVLKIASFIGRK